MLFKSTLLFLRECRRAIFLLVQIQVKGMAGQNGVTISVQ